MKIYPITMEDEQHNKLRIKCFKKNMTMREVFINAIEDFIAEDEHQEEINTEPKLEQIF